jgi:hypothetical protein
MLVASLALADPKRHLTFGDQKVSLGWKAEVRRGLARTQFCRGVPNGLESIRHFYEAILRTTRKRALPLIIRS